MLIDCKNSVEAGQEGTVPVRLPGCQRGLHSLRQGAGGGGFIELVLWSSERSQHARCNSANITMKRQPANNCAHVHTQSAAEQHAEVLVSSYLSRGWRSSLRSR